jgi:nitrite reductase (NO-forming)
MMRTDEIKVALLLILTLLFAGCGVQAEASAPEQLFTLRTGIADGRLVYIGVGGAIDGIINPELTVHSGARVRIDIVNGDGVGHDLALPGLAVQTPLGTKGRTVGATFAAHTSGVYPYLCTVAGHRQAGMEGRLVVTP